jgi:hypothetical protein
MQLVKATVVELCISKESIIQNNNTPNGIIERVFRLSHDSYNKVNVIAWHLVHVCSTIIQLYFLFMVPWTWSKLSEHSLTVK